MLEHRVTHVQSDIFHEISGFAVDVIFIRVHTGREHYVGESKPEAHASKDVAVVTQNLEGVRLTVFELFPLFDIDELQRKLGLLPEVFFEKCKVGIVGRV